MKWGIIGGCDGGLRGIMGKRGEMCRKCVGNERILSKDVLSQVSKPLLFCRIGGGCVGK